LKKILITLGASGGHIYPALAVMDYIKSIDNTIETRLINSRNSKIFVPDAHRVDVMYKINSIGFIGKSFIYKIKSLFLFAVSVIQSLKIIFTFMPDAIVGTGGFVSLPVAIAGFVLNRKIYIIEGNSVPGLSNKIISKFCKKIFINFDHSTKYFNKEKCIKTGFPIRELDNKVLKNKSLDLLILGGSQGSAIINSKVAQSVRSLLEKIASSESDIKHLRITHQCGSNNKESTEGLYLSMKENFSFFEFEVYEFIDNINEFYSKSKVLISRAGASTIAESLKFKVPSIYIPIKHSSGNHQYLNAKEISDNKLAFVHLEENPSEELTVKIEKLLYNKEINESMAEALEKYSSLNENCGAEKIAKEILKDFD